MTSPAIRARLLCRVGGADRRPEGPPPPCRARCGAARPAGRPAAVGPAGTAAGPRGGTRAAGTAAGPKGGAGAAGTAAGPKGGTGAAGAAGSAAGPKGGTGAAGAAGSAAGPKGGTGAAGAAGSSAGRAPLALTGPVALKWLSGLTEPLDEMAGTEPSGPVESPGETGGMEGMEPSGLVELMRSGVSGVSGTCGGARTSGRSGTSGGPGGSARRGPGTAVPRGLAWPPRSLELQDTIRLPVTFAVSARDQSLWLRHVVLGPVAYRKSVCREPGPAPP
jgi:hypothetical protein